jgi:hypothetical protein
MISQKQAFTNALLTVFPDYEMGGEVILKDIISKEQKDLVSTMVVEGFKSGQVSLSPEAQAKYLDQGDDKALIKYSMGTLDNWLRKNRDFNNGFDYETKNPGSRTGSQDATVKALRGLLKTDQSAEAKIEIEQAIADRLAEIKPASVVEIDVDKLPEHLRHLVK